jgi:hypothetical protein
MVFFYPLKEPTVDAFPLGFCYCLKDTIFIRKGCSMMDILKSKTEMKSRKVIVWGKNDLLSSSVISFLSALKDWEVINLSNGQGIDDLIQEVETIRPDAIIIYQRYCARSAHLPAQLLSIYSGISVITINSDDNLMEIYNKKQVNVREPSDFISAIEQSPHSSKE